MASVSMKSDRRLIERISFRLFIIASLFVVLGLATGWLFLHLGWVDVWMFLLALGTCVISSLVAHVVGEYPSGDANIMARFAVGIAARTGLPFLVVISARLASSEPLGTGFVALVILFYLVGLVADISLHVLRMKAAN